MSLSKEQRDNYVSWGGLLDVGRDPDEEEILKFTGVKRIIYRIGYKSKRIVYNASDSRHIEVECTVLKSTLSGTPLFECSYKLDTNSDVITITAKNPTEVANRVVRLLCNSNHKWSGNEFFGFRRTDVLRNTSKNNVKFNWLGMKSYGIPIISDDRYIYAAGNSCFRLQPGFESVRTVTIDEKKFNIHCKIVASTEGPMFQCFAENTEFETQTTTKPTVAMNEIFKMLNIPKTRNRSGYEFFGFNRSDVLNIIKAPITSYGDLLVADEHATITADENIEPCINKLQAIHDRNAGPTSTLLHMKSKRARNKAIHDAVNFASFNDIESKCVFLNQTKVDFRLCAHWNHSLFL